MNVIAITAHGRPELLKLNLEQLGTDKNIVKYKIRIYVNEGYDKDIHTVVNRFGSQFRNLDIKVILQKNVHCYLPGYYNILNAYRLAAEEASDYVMIGEEDIIPTTDYIRFNHHIYKYILSKFKRIFCVAHKRRPETEKLGDPEILIGDTQCTSPTCVTVESIKRYMIPYFNHPLYWADPIRFNLTTFPQSRIPPHVITHHYGQIERIIEAYQLFALKPDRARTMHVGISGIHCRDKEPQGCLNERYQQYRDLILSGGETMRERTGGGSDITVVPLEGPEWSNLRIDINRNLAKASSWWYDPENKFKEYINAARYIRD